MSPHRPVLRIQSVWICFWILCLNCVTGPLNGDALEATCGFRQDFDEEVLPKLKPIIGSRIIGGTDSRLGEWPWMVSLQKGRMHFCGGSIIGHWWILTASHCLSDIVAKKIKISYAITSLTEKAMSVKVKKIIMHPLYSNVNGNNDIALLLLSSYLHLNKLSVPICLPPAEIYKPDAWKTCYVTGWGTTSHGLSHIPQNLKKVKLVLFSREKCLEWMGPLTDNMICAGFEKGGRDACQGDSGGPLVCQTVANRTWYQVGIVSWGRGCGEAKKPGVYAVVSNYVDWIYEETAKEGKPLGMIYPAMGSEDIEKMTWSGLNDNETSNCSARKDKLAWSLLVLIASIVHQKPH